MIDRSELPEFEARGFELIETDQAPPQADAEAAPELEDELEAESDGSDR